MKSYANFEGISPYLNKLGRFQPLGREEEIILAKKAKKGDKNAYERLANSHLALVVSVAKKYARRGAGVDDLVQEGNVGLLKAIDHFDPKKGTRLSTYAVWWIQAYIKRYLQNNRSQVRGGDDEREILSDFWLDSLIEKDSNITFQDKLVDENADTEQAYYKEEKARNVRAALHRVKKRLGSLSWDILQDRLTQESPLSLEEIGKRWGVSRERVRQVEKKTISFLSRYLEAQAA